MKVIDWKAYKEVDLKELSNKELIEVISDLQDRVKKLESSTSGFIATTPNPRLYVDNFPNTIPC